MTLVGAGIMRWSFKGYFSHFGSPTEKQGLVARQLPNMYKTVSLVSSTEVEKKEEEEEEAISLMCLALCLLGLNIS